MNSSKHRRYKLMQHIQTTITRDPCQETNLRNDIMFFSNWLPCTLIYIYIYVFILNFPFSFISFLHFYLSFCIFFCNDREIFIYIFDHNSIIIDEIKEVRLSHSFFFLFYIPLVYLYHFIFLCNDKEMLIYFFIGIFHEFDNRWNMERG